MRKDLTKLGETFLSEEGSPLQEKVRGMKTNKGILEPFSDSWALWGSK